MGDRTLLAEEIRSRSGLENTLPLLSPFCPGSLKAASYDIRAGDTAIKSLAPQDQREGKKYKYIDLEHERYVEIEPEESYTFYSREEVNIPVDMQALLLNRYHWVTKRLNFDGGVVEPDYKGYLFLTFTNIGDSPVKIQYEDALVSAVFVRLDKPATGHPKERKTRLDENRLPPPPAGLRQNTIELSRRIQDLESKLKELEPQITLQRTVSELVVFAVIAGIILALATKSLDVLPTPLTALTGPQWAYLGGLAMVLFGIWILYKRLKKRAKT